MKRSSTIFLRVVIGLIGLAALSVCVILIPELVREDAVEHPQDRYLALSFMLGSYAVAAPFFIALFQGWKLVDLIDKNKAFSKASVNIMRNIKYCAAAIAILFTAGTVWMAIVAHAQEDLPGPAAIGMMFIFASLVIATFAGILERLLQNIVDIKSENDATV